MSFLAVCVIFYWLSWGIGGSSCVFIWKGRQKCGVLPIVTWFGEMAAAGDWKLETVDMETFLVSVCKQSDKIVLLQV